MANMSYCRFQNTLSDLRDCYYAMEDEEKLSESESEAKASLIQPCQKIVDEFANSPQN